MATPTQGSWFIPCIWTKPGFLTPWAPSPRAPASPTFLYLWWNCSAPQCFLHLPHCARAHTLIRGWRGISITEPGLEFHNGPFQAHLLPLPLRTLALSQADSYPPGFQLPLPHSQHFQNGECLSHPRGLEPAPPFMTNIDSILKSRDITLPTKVSLVKDMVFPVVMYGCESWTIKKAEHWRIDASELWCWRLESPLDCMEIQPVGPKGNHPWIFIWRTEAEAEILILWLPDAKNWLIWKDPDAGKDWWQEEKGTTEDEMFGWHHRLNGHEFE